MKKIDEAFVEKVNNIGLVVEDNEFENDVALMLKVARTLKDNGVEFTPEQFAQNWYYMKAKIRKPDYTWEQYRADNVKGGFVTYAVLAVVALAPAFGIGYILNLIPSISLLWWHQVLAAPVLAAIPFIIRPIGSIVSEKKRIKKIKTEVFNKN